MLKEGVWPIENLKSIPVVNNTSGLQLFTLQDCAPNSLESVLDSKVVGMIKIYIFLNLAFARVPG